jgi:ribosomal protein L16
MRGTTVVWGDYGIRMRDHDRRISAQQLRIAEECIKKRLRGMKFRLYMRIAANIGVYTSGNESRMGKGKGSFDRWTARVAVSKIIFEIKGDLHEQVVRDAFGHHQSRAQRRHRSRPQAASKEAADGGVGSTFTRGFGGSRSVV